MVAVKMHQLKKEKGKFVIKGSEEITGKVQNLAKSFVEHFNDGALDRGQIYVIQEKKSKKK